MVHHIPSATVELGPSEATDTQAGSPQELAIIDCDVHHQTADFPREATLAAYLPERWSSYVETFGLRSVAQSSQVPPHRAVGNKGSVARNDSVPPSGADPGSDPDFAREQLLDEYGISAAILNTFGGLGMAVGNIPARLGIELSRAFNDWTYEHWLQSDPRWLSSICVPYEYPAEAVKEIVRCREMSDRFVQVLIGSRTNQPIGNPHYWPILEAAADLGLPVGFHVGYCRTTSFTACGAPSYYYERHVDFALQPLTLVPSLIFEGVFERWPALKIALVEFGWDWAIALSWRMDASWAVMRDEVPELTRKPSEYFHDNFWFTTQPMIQPSQDKWLVEVLDQFERVGFKDKLMYSSDYPHWDFDAPDRVLPPAVPREARQKIMAGNASALYGIEL